ncbi:MAG: RagB/SusD family nutrient uptake outer membrane protein [Tannerellaceae bacterium]|jgi:hypothetical protein|nr:RagB/SusD family nutrient uptake outer membrane protein [Tannerellaceae bacterium]
MKHKLLTIIGFAALLTFGSCGEDFLYKDPQGSLAPEVLDNEQGAELLVTSTYANLHENDWGASIFNWTFGGMYGGDANKGSDPGDQSVLNEMELYNTLSTNSYLGEKWKWVYKGSKRASLALNVLNKAEMDEALRNTRKAEVYMLRAMFYFEGVKVFGPYIPYVDETYMENNPKVANDKDIYPLIIADIDKAIEGLPEIHRPAGGGDPVPGRVNVWAAQMLKAKILMQYGKIAEAKPILAKVLTEGQTSFGLKYGLADDLTQNWDAMRDNTSPESIWEIQFSIDGPNNNANSGMSLCYPHNSGPGGCCGFYQPSFELVNSYQVDENGLPYLNGEYRSKPSVSKQINTDAFVENDKDIAVDPRLDFAVGRYHVPYKDWGFPGRDWIRNPTNGGIFLPKKHVYTLEMFNAELGSPSYGLGWSPGSAMNIQYLSVRDALLLYAECLANDGDLKGAMDQVNQVRARAALDVNIIRNEDGTPAATYKVEQYPSTHQAFSSQETCIKAIRMERKLELAMEGQRWFDLARWGGDYMSSELRAYLDYEKVPIPKFESASYLPPEKVMFPIPDSQIQAMGTDESGKSYLIQPNAWK